MIRLVELDGATYRLDGAQITALADLRAVRGDKWVVTDFREALSRLMAVEGPAKYAELLARRKLQETGEFEEPVEIITHWKRQRSKTTSDIFFTAVPTRLSHFYFDELRQDTDIALIFPIYAVLWQVIQQLRSRHPVAVVLRHERFAQVLVGSRKRVYFANRCVAFDSEPEQLRALWENVRTDLEGVQKEHRVEIDKIICLGWRDAGELPDWPAPWQERIYSFKGQETAPATVSGAIPLAAMLAIRNAWRSASPAAEIALFYARRWSPVVNLAMAMLLVVLAAGAYVCRQQSDALAGQLNLLQRQMGKIQVQAPAQQNLAGFSEQLKFIETLAQLRRQPAYQEIIEDLSPPDFSALQLQLLKLTYQPQIVQVELFGDIEAPFDEAHKRYKAFLQHLERKGYRIEENRFETQISTSQVVLKLSRPIA